MRVAVTPRLLRDLVAANLEGDGIEVTTDGEPVVSVVTVGRENSTHSRAVIVLGDSVDGDVRVLVEGEPAVERSLDAGDLRALVLDLADRVTPDDLSQGAPPRTVPPQDRGRPASTPAG